MPEVICQCELVGKKSCPVHLTVYKLRFADGTFALKGIPPKGQHHGGKAWSQKGHLKNAILRQQQPIYEHMGPEAWRHKLVGTENWLMKLNETEPVTILEISGTGVKEYTLEEFMKL